MADARDLRLQTLFSISVLYVILHFLLIFFNFFSFFFRGRQLAKRQMELEESNSRRRKMKKKNIKEFKRINLSRSLSYELWEEEVAEKDFINII